jgi:hypothetical protein
MYCLLASMHHLVNSGMTKVAPLNTGHMLLQAKRCIVMGSSFRISGARGIVLGKELETIDRTSICQAAAAPQASVIHYHCLPG